MPVSEDPEMRKLAAGPPELAQLLAEHKKLDREVAALDKRHVRTPGEEIKRRQLSKLKLANRDRIVQVAAKLKKQAK